MCPQKSNLLSHFHILDSAVFRTVGGKLWSIVDDLADGWFADDVSGASGRVSARDEVLEKTTEINLGLCSMFTENV